MSSICFSLSSGHSSSTCMWLCKFVGVKCVHSVCLFSLLNLFPMPFAYLFVLSFWCWRCVERCRFAGSSNFMIWFILSGLYINFCLFMRMQTSNNCSLKLNIDGCGHLKFVRFFGIMRILMLPQSLRKNLPVWLSALLSFKCSWFRLPVCY